MNVTHDAESATFGFPGDLRAESVIDAPATPAVRPMPKRPAARICANGHERLVHYETECPMCRALGLVREAYEAVEFFKGHIRCCHGAACKQLVRRQDEQVAAQKNGHMAWEDSPATP